MIQVKLKDDVREFEAGISAAEVAKSISMGLYKACCACEINGVVCDLRTPLTENCQVTFLTFDDKEGQKVFWHTASHILAQAVKRLYPNVKLCIGPAIDNGFYYDFDTEEAFTPEMLTAIEGEMKKIVKENLPLEKFELSPEEAVKYLSDLGETYKVELAEEHADKGENISFYKQGISPTFVPVLI